MAFRISTLATLLAGAALVVAAPALAEPSTHGAGGHPSTHGFAARPRAVFHRPVTFHNAVRPSFARPGFHSVPAHGIVRPVYRPLHAVIVGHVPFARFTPAERAVWTHGRWFHRWWHGRWGWWWFAGGGWFWYDAPIWPYPTIVSNEYYEEPDYAPATWYYCYNPAGYYPYVQYCNGPWRPVPAQVYPQDQSGPEQGPPPNEQQYGYGQPPPASGSQDQQGPPPGYDQGPQQGYDQGPPPGYGDGEGPYDQGPPPGYDQGEQGPPPGYDQGPPPGSSQGSNNQQGPQ